jgi:nucleoside 2-deoxyribosyltransferase
LAKTVYLAGSIYRRRSLSEANKWRLYAKEKLEAAGYDVINPLDGKRDGIEYDAHEIVRDDLAAIRRSHVLLVEMDNPRLPYIGTSMEIFFASTYGKTVILWGRANKKSYWLRAHAHRWFRSLDEAIEHLRKEACRWTS